MYAPMLAAPFKGLDVRPYLESGRHCFQQKFDGDRLMAVWRPGARVQFVTRNGTVYTRKIPAALRDLHRPAWDDTSTIIIDGELVGDTWYVFDFLVTRFGEASDPQPYEERRRRLVSRVPAHRKAMITLVPEVRTPDLKALFLEQALERHAEGIVVKTLDSKYRFGARSNHWLKIKFERTADVIIRSVRQKGKESAEMVMHDPDSPNPIVFVGDVSILGKSKESVQPGQVAEVKYLYATDDHILYQPRILRVRDDKAPSECTVDQLVYTDKGVLIR